MGETGKKAVVVYPLPLSKTPDGMGQTARVSRVSERKERVFSVRLHEAEEARGCYWPLDWAIDVVWHEVLRKGADSGCRTGEGKRM